MLSIAKIITLFIGLTLALVAALASCEGAKRGFDDMNSDVGGGKRIRREKRGIPEGFLIEKEWDDEELTRYE